MRFEEPVRPVDDRTVGATGENGGMKYRKLKTDASKHSRKLCRNVRVATAVIPILANGFGRTVERPAHRIEPQSFICIILNCNCSARLQRANERFQKVLRFRNQPYDPADQV